MPEKDGIETIIELRKDFPEVKIIAMSGGGSIGVEDYLMMAKGLGAMRIFSKPIEWEELLKAVRELLEWASIVFNEIITGENINLCKSG